MSDQNKKNIKSKGLLNKTFYFTGFTFGKISSINRAAIKSLNWKNIKSKTQETVETAKKKSTEVASGLKNGTVEIAESFVAGVKSVKGDAQPKEKQENIPADKELSVQFPEHNPTQKEDLTADKELSVDPNFKINPIDATSSTKKMKIDVDLEKEIEKIDKAIKDL